MRISNIDEQIIIPNIKDRDTVRAATSVLFFSFDFAVVTSLFYWKNRRGSRGKQSEASCNSRCNEPSSRVAKYVDDRGKRALDLCFL